MRSFVLLLALAVSLTACGPWGPKGIIAGGPLLGSAEPTPDDWSFTDAHPLVAIETRGSVIRHSVTILCVAADGDLYVMARHAPRKRWIQNLGVDPRVRLEIGGKLYEGRAVRVGAADGETDVARAFLRKYVGVEAEAARPLEGPPAAGDDHAEVWTFRIDPPEPAS